MNMQALNNLIRIGTIVQVDLKGEQAQATTARVKVDFGQHQSAWLPMIALRAGNAKVWWPLSVGEQVLVLSPGGDADNGIVLGALYSSKNPSPDTQALEDSLMIEFAEGSTLSVNQEGVIAKLTNETQLTVEQGNLSVTIAAGDCSITAAGNLNLKADGAITLEASGDCTIKGANVNVEGGTINLN